MEHRAKDRKSGYAMVLVEDALRMVLEAAPRLDPTTVPLHEALGHVVAEDVRAREPLPPFDASVMDGYAVVAEDGIGEFQVVARVHAGSGVDVHVRSGTAAYITTGAKLPPGANAVVKVEDTEEGELGPNGKEATVKILRRVTNGTFVRTTGSDIAEGQLVVPRGTFVHAAEVGLLATVGVVEVPVYRKPIVGVMSTGDELLEASSTSLVGSKIRDSNRPSLLAALREQGFEVLDAGIVVDLSSMLRSCIIDALARCDVLIASGGVSMGDADLLKPILEELGTVHFGRLMMKPGKPSTFATIMQDGKQKLFFGLPGNPVSCLVCKALLVDPALKKMQGLDDALCMHPQVKVALTSEIKLDPERPEYHRALVRWDDIEHRLFAYSTGTQLSSRLLSMASANALLCIPKADGFLPEGALVTALLIGDLAPPLLGQSYHSRSVDHAHKHSHRAHGRSRSHKHGHGGHTHDHIHGSGHEHEHGSGHEHDHGHGHEHEQDHGHGRAHEHEHDHGHGHAHEHEHDHGHGHEHKHDHAHGHGHGQGHNREHSHKRTKMKKGPYVAEGLEITTAVIVMSDRAHAQVYEDQAGPALCAELAALNVAMRFTFVSTIVVPDEPTAIATAFLYCTDTLQVDLVITSGGTGFGPRDVTPETIRPLLHREAPGVVMALLNEGLKHTPLAVLSRPVVGTRGNCFVVTLPGSVKAVRENVRALEPLLPRIMTLLKSGTCEH